MRNLKPMTDWGVEVKSFLARQGMSLTRLAELAGVKRGTLQETLVGRTEGHEVKPAVRRVMEEMEATRA